jgi:hypothetical protein
MERTMQKICFWPGILGTIFFVTNAIASQAWECTYMLDGGFRAKDIFVEETPSTLTSHVTEVSDQLNKYDILENSSEGLIAIHHYSEPPEDGKPTETGAVIIAINKLTGEFRMFGILLSALDENVTRGSCTVMKN